MTGRTFGTSVLAGVATASLALVVAAVAEFDGFPPTRGLHRQQDPVRSAVPMGPRRPVIADQVFNERRRPGSGPAWPRQRVIFAAPFEAEPPQALRRPDFGQWSLTPDMPAGWEAR